MSVPALLQGRLRLPVVGSPLFIVSNPELVIEQCKAGIVGSFPALNARPKEQLETWLQRITSGLASCDHAAPYAVNQIVHASNDRLAHDMDVCERYRVPIVITSLRVPDEIVPRVHGWGGLVFHDVISVRHARRAMQAGVDGLILVCAGAGGHAGMLSPFALVQEVRRFFGGTILLAGAIASGDAVLAAQAAGADLAYLGTRFIATREANAKPEYKKMLIDAAAADIVYTPLFTGVHGNYLRPSVAAAGLDPDNLPLSDKKTMNFGSGGNVEKKVWRDIWSAGQGVGGIDDAPKTAEVVDRLAREYQAAYARLGAQADPFLRFPRASGT
ncbi:MAG: nitronate monooxygenase family protein [Burkholderiales bacterium]